MKERARRASLLFGLALVPSGTAEDTAGQSEGHTSVGGVVYKRALVPSGTYEPGTAEDTGSQRGAHLIIPWDAVVVIDRESHTGIVSIRKGLINHHGLGDKYFGLPNSVIHAPN